MNLIINSKVKLRLRWINFYKQVQNMSKVCQYYGISHLTLRKWIHRYEKLGQDGLVIFSSKPKTSPLQKRNESNEQLIIQLRKGRQLGARRVQSELKRLHAISFSLSTIHKVFKNCKIPGERVQMDVCQIAKGLYQYTAIDGCTRYKVIALYTRRTATNTLDFLEQIKQRMPFYLQRIQTDRSNEFFAYEVQKKLQEWKIKFRPIRPASPHLNGKVERAQRTDLDEFYSSISIQDPKLPDNLLEWEEYYNKCRPHSSLQGKTPLEKYKSLKKAIPCLKTIQANYDSSEEKFAIQNYEQDKALKCLIKKISEKKQRERP